MLFNPPGTTFHFSDLILCNSKGLRRELRGVTVAAPTSSRRRRVGFERRCSKPGGRRTSPAGRRIEIGRPGAWESLLFQAILSFVLYFPSVTGVTGSCAQ